MSEVPRSIHLSKRIADILAREAGRQNVSVDEIANSAIEAYIDWQVSEREILERRISEADEGMFVSSEAVLAWMKQLEDDAAAPFPELDILPLQG